MLPIPSSAQSPHRLDDAADPASRALAQYERQFKCHFQKGHHIYIASQAKIEWSRRLVQEQQVQGMAFENARANMEFSCKMFNQLYMDFMKQFDQHEMSVWVHTNMQRVASLQSNIRNIRFELSAFKEAMRHQDDIFAKLKSIRKIGPSYRACLAEVVRRKASMKLYMGQAGQLAEKLASRREFEVQRRLEFLKLQSDYIPQDVLEGLGLFDVPRQCVVNIEPFDSSLLDIDVADLERYAPESLVGLLAKGDPNAQGKGSFSPFSSSYHSGNGEQSYANSGKQYEAGIMDDDYDDDCILGTRGGR